MLRDRVPEVHAQHIAMHAIVLARHDAGWRNVHHDLLHEAPLLMLTEEIFPVDLDFIYADRLPALEEVDESDDEGAAAASISLSAPW